MSNRNIRNRIPSADLSLETNSGQLTINDGQRAQSAIAGFSGNYPITTDPAPTGISDLWTLPSYLYTEHMASITSTVTSGTPISANAFWTHGVWIITVTTAIYAAPGQTQFVIDEDPAGPNLTSGSRASGSLLSMGLSGWQGVSGYEYIQPGTYKARSNGLVYANTVSNIIEVTPRPPELGAGAPHIGQITKNNSMWGYFNFNTNTRTGTRGWLRLIYSGGQPAPTARLSISARRIK